MPRYKIKQSNEIMRLLVQRTDGRVDLFGMVEALEIVFAEESAILGFSAARHALAEVDPEIVAATFVPRNSPP